MDEKELNEADEFVIETLKGEPPMDLDFAFMYGFYASQYGLAVSENPYVIHGYMKTPNNSWLPYIKRWLAGYREYERQAQFAPNENE